MRETFLSGASLFTASFAARSWLTSRSPSPARWCWHVVAWLSRCMALGGVIDPPAGFRPTRNWRRKADSPHLVIRAALSGVLNSNTDRGAPIGGTRATFVDALHQTLWQYAKHPARPRAPVN